MVKLLAILSLAVAFTFAVPRDAAAESCTQSYIGCIAGAGLLEEPFRTMQDAECTFEYFGCLVSKLRFW
jgi:hypothetical protein